MLTTGADNGFDAGSTKACKRVGNTAQCQHMPSVIMAAISGWPGLASGNTGACELRHPGLRGCVNHNTASALPADVSP